MARIEEKERIKWYGSVFLALLLMVSPLAVSSAQAATDWQVSLRVGDAAGHNRLVLGAHDTATDGYDILWDVYALLGGNFEAYFPHPEWNILHNILHRDIRAHFPNGTKEWVFVVDASGAGADVSITWDLSDLPEGYPITLIDDETGAETNMRSNSSYNFTYSTTRNFRVAVTESDVVDTDGDTIPDDGDGSGVVGDNPCSGGNTSSCDDNCLSTANAGQEDSDGDGVGDVCDNCSQVANTDQRDTNASEDDNSAVSGIQHYGNICDPDFDNNGMVGLEDFNTWRQYFRQTVPPAPGDIDLDGNGTIGLEDFNIWRQYFRSAPGPGITE